METGSSRTRGRGNNVACTKKSREDQSVCIHIYIYTCDMVVHIMESRESGGGDVE